ncbi:hypothetical protein LTR86_007683 [Recurvomyces mirabilis]|nr:hypothetical protein LTR86_007683 [Recurvomyces mirabilis]
MLASIVLTVLALVSVYYVATQITKTKSLPPGSRLPDGPPGKPFVGNLPDIPPKHSWLKFYEWKKKYGDLYRIKLAGRTNIIVSTEEIANDLLRERGNIYSSREQLPMAAQLLSDNLRPLLLPYGSEWREVRKLMHSLTNVSMVSSYETVQEEESTRMVRDLIREPRAYEKWFNRYSAGLILRIAYSKPVETGEEEYVKRIMQVNHQLERIASPGSYLVDTFPILMKLPSFLAPFKTEGKRLHAEELNLFRDLLDQGIAAPDATAPNFCQKWDAEKDKYHLSRDHVAYAIGTMFEAGAGTTSAAMGSFLLAMTLHENEFRELQAEVDAVVGHDRLPQLSDMPNLPRVRAVAKETLRWRPVTAGGLPHQLTKDDVYTLEDGDKVFLEAGANVHPVQWSIHREPKRYPDADSFRPERWLEPSWPTFKEPLTTHPNLQNFSAFGFGRRICAGQHIAERSLYIEIAKIAWCCHISQVENETGIPIPPPDYDYVAGFNTHPKDFMFNLKARPGRIEVIEREYQTVWGHKTSSSLNTS